MADAKEQALAWANANPTDPRAKQIHAKIWAMANPQDPRSAQILQKISGQAAMGPIGGTLASIAEGVVPIEEAQALAKTSKPALMGLLTAPVGMEDIAVPQAGAVMSSPQYQQNLAEIKAPREAFKQENPTLGLAEYAPAAGGLAQLGIGLARMAPAVTGKVVDIVGPRVLGYKNTALVKAAAKGLAGGETAGITGPEAAKKIAEATPLVSEQALPYTGLSPAEMGAAKQAEVSKSSNLAQQKIDALKDELSQRVANAPGTVRVPTRIFTEAGLHEDPVIANIISQQTGFPTTTTQTTKSPYFPKEPGVSPEFRRQGYKTPASVEQSLTQPETQQSLAIPGLTPAPLPPEMTKNMPAVPGTKTYRITRNPIGAEPSSQEFLAQQQRLPVQQRTTTTTITSPETPDTLTLTPAQLDRLRIRVNALAKYKPVDELARARQQKIGAVADQLRAAENATVPESDVIRDTMTRDIAVQKNLAKGARKLQQGKPFSIPESQAAKVDEQIPGSSLADFLRNSREAGDYDTALKGHNAYSVSTQNKVIPGTENLPPKTLDEFLAALRSGAPSTPEYLNRAK